MIYLWITISQLFVCLPFLELTTFEQQVCSTRIGYANALLLGINSFKKETWPLWTAHIKQNSSEASIRTTTERFTQLLLNLVNLRDSVLEKSWKKVYSRTTTKSVPLLQPEHEFCQQNGSERGEVQYWYPNEKMLVVLVCFSNGYCWWSSFVSVMDIVLQGVWLLYHSNKYEGDESLPFPAFRRDVVSAIFWNIQKNADYPWVM